MERRCSDGTEGPEEVLVHQQMIALLRGSSPPSRSVTDPAIWGSRRSSVPYRLQLDDGAGQPMAEDEAPGWDAIHRAINPLVGGTAPLHWGTQTSLPDHDGLWGISAYRVSTTGSS